MFLSVLINLIKKKCFIFDDSEKKVDPENILETDHPLMVCLSYLQAFVFLMTRNFLAQNGQQLQNFNLNSRMVYFLDKCNVATFYMWLICRHGSHTQMSATLRVFTVAQNSIVFTFFFYKDNKPF